jgi:hypothetical protein
MAVLTFQYHDLWKQYLYQLQYGTAIKPTGFHAMLLGTGVATNSMTLANLVALELTAADGYTRKTFTPDPTGGLVLGQWVGDAPLSWTVTAAKTWQHLLVIANGASTVGNTTGVPVFIGTLDIPENLIANIPRRLTLIVGG